MKRATTKAAAPASVTLSVMLALLLAFFGSAPLPAYADDASAENGGSANGATEVDGYTRVFVPLRSNLTNKTGFSGFYKDNVFYVSLDDLCALSGAYVDSQGGNEVTLKTSSGLRRFDLEVGSGNMQERLFSESFTFTCPSALINGQVYVSALHFLNYLGAVIDVNPDAASKITVLKQYDVIDALGDLKAMDNGHFFWWDELDLTDEELHDRLVNAGVIALINQDPNYLRMIFDASGMEQDAIEDILIDIVKNEGAPYLDDVSSRAADELGFALDSASYLADAADFIEGAYSDSLVSQTDAFSAFAAASTAFSAGSDVLSALESVNEFDSMTSAQKALLSETILAYPEDSSTICNGWEKIYRAASQVDADMQGAYSSAYPAVVSALLDNANAVFDAGAKGDTLFANNPVEFAWNSIVQIYQSFPASSDVIDRKTHLYNAYNASFVQLVADELLQAAWSDIDRANFAYTDAGTEYNALQRVKSALILRIKATTTTRDSLISSGFLDQSLADQMTRQNIELSSLLHDTESCRINGCNLYSPDYDDDLSWMANCVDYASAFYDQLVAQTGVASTDITTTYQTGPVTGELAKYGTSSGQTRMSEIAAPDDSQTGMVYRSIGDFDGNGYADLLVGELQGENLESTFAGQHDLAIPFTLYYFGNGPQPMQQGSLTMSLSAQGNDTLFAFVDGSRFVMVKETDDLGRPYDQAPGDRPSSFPRRYEFDTEIAVYDLSSPEDFWGASSAPRYRKHFLHSENGEESLAYQFSTDSSAVSGSVLYSMNYDDDAPSEFGSEQEACDEINAELATYVSVPLGQLEPVPFDDRAAASFIPDNLDGLSSYVLISSETSERTWVSDFAAEGTAHITGTYQGV